MKWETVGKYWKWVLCLVVVLVAFLVGIVVGSYLFSSSTSVSPEREKTSENKAKNVEEDNPSVCTPVKKAKSEITPEVKEKKSPIAELMRKAEEIRNSAKNVFIGGPIVLGEAAQAAAEGWAKSEIIKAEAIKDGVGKRALEEKLSEKYKQDETLVKILAELENEIKYLKERFGEMNRELLGKIDKHPEVNKFWTARVEVVEIIEKLKEILNAIVAKERPHVLIRKIEDLARHLEQKSEVLELSPEDIKGLKKIKSDLKQFYEERKEKK